MSDSARFVGVGARRVTRIRLRTGPTAMFGGMLLLALIVFLPMRAALGWVGIEDAGLVARRVTGTIWGATLTDARFGELSLGNLHARLAPLPLLAGRARIVLAGPETNPRPLRGSASVSRHGFGVDDLTATIPTGAVFAPVPVTTLDLDGVTVRFADGQCERAEGRVRATLGGEVAGITLPQSVSGTPKCEGDALIVPLASQAGTEGITLRIDGTGRYRAVLTLQPTDPIVEQRLESIGFVRGAGGYSQAIEGSF